ncbi:MAG: hypothetical protein IKH92_05075 [Clostridiales bacterium]|nr:hypothetical protein [Clostridiales bacterium]
MAQKYSRWQRGENYPNGRLLAKKYENIDAVPPLSSDSSYTFNKTANEKEGMCTDTFDSLEIDILGIITTFSFLTFNQLYTLLELRREKYSKTSVRRTLDKLIDLSMIVKYSLESVDVDGVCEEIKIYSRSRFKTFHSNEIPNLNYKSRLLVRSECGNSWSTIGLSIVVANQIVINQMIYGEKVRHIRVENVMYMPKCKIVVLLEMETDQGVYFFVSAMHAPFHKIQEILTDWTSYAMAQKKSFNLIFITRDEKNLVETINAVNATKFFGFQVGYTIFSDWFRKSRAAIMMRSIII